MKNFIYYIKDWRIIVGLLFIISTFGLSAEGRAFRSKWDSSIQYQEPASAGKKAGFIVIGLVFIFAGIGKKKQQLQNQSNNDSNSKTTDGQQ